MTFILGQNLMAFQIFRPVAQASHLQSTADTPEWILNRVLNVLLFSCPSLQQFTQILQKYRGKEHPSSK